MAETGYVCLCGHDMDDHLLWEGPCLLCLEIHEEVPVWDPCYYFQFEEDVSPFDVSPAYQLREEETQ